MHSELSPSLSVRAARRLRGYPRMWSCVCRSLHYYNTSIVGAKCKQSFAEHRSQLESSDTVERNCESLRGKGYALVPGFLEDSERLFAKADQLFRDGKISNTPFYGGEYKTLENVAYEDLARTQKTIAIANPLLQLPEFVDLAFHPMVLSTTAKFLGYIPPRFGVNVVRDFPHSRPKESSNFHKDNEEADSLQIFLYLVDIDDFCGPLVYVPGSHRHDAQSCRPRVSRDIGVSGYDGRISDDEVRKYYPESKWDRLNVKAGGLAFVFGNGLHKGPDWRTYGDPNNRARTALRIDVQSYGKGVRKFKKQVKLRKADYDRMSPTQKLFTDAYEVV